ncbi:MAG: hypothetical protein KH138_13845, partial [Firmicutes bacterium]|nr:hypothetical protein [Bacillota bacterium]
NPSFSAKQKTVEFQRFPLILNGFLLFQDVPRSTMRYREKRLEWCKKGVVILGFYAIFAGLVVYAVISQHIHNILPAYPLKCPYHPGKR